MSHIPTQRIGIQSETEEPIEELVADIRLIRSVEREQRSGLRGWLRLRKRSRGSPRRKRLPGLTEAERASVARSGNSFHCSRYGFFLIVPLIGVTLAFIGFVMAIWGAALSFFKK